jgi:hypothetical protein
MGNKAKNEDVNAALVMVRNAPPIHLHLKPLYCSPPKPVFVHVLLSEPFVCLLSPRSAERHVCTRSMVEANNKPNGEAGMAEGAGGGRNRSSALRRRLWAAVLDRAVSPR